MLRHVARPVDEVVSPGGGQAELLEPRELPRCVGVALERARADDVLRRTGVLGVVAATATVNEMGSLVDRTVNGIVG